MVMILMVAKVASVAFCGMTVLPIEVQVQLSSGLPAFTIVGLPDKAVAESRERVRASFHAMGLALPAKRITVNLSPADVQKEGSHYDLPIALGLLLALDILPADALESMVALGELSLDGSVTAVTGVLPAALQASRMSMGIICPKESGGEAAWAGDLPIIATSHLLSLVNHFKGHHVLERPLAKLLDDEQSNLDFCDIKGQEVPKRAFEIAAAGGHNLLMVGPPGAGKSMLASRLPSILPELSPKEALEATMIHSLAGFLSQGGLMKKRPYRDPHHSSSLASMVGGGAKSRPGEISLAHTGVLFLDELPEFNRSTLESLRQPLENFSITVARANQTLQYPARMLLVAAMNPCKCGFLGDELKACAKAPRCGQDYQNKLSGPLLDRIDLHVFVRDVPAKELLSPGKSEPSSEIAKRVKQARLVQEKRFLQLGSDLTTNAQASGQILDQIIKLSDAAQKLLEKVMEKHNLSARSYHRLLKVARTIVDLAEEDVIQHHHLSEALSFKI